MKEKIPNFTENQLGGPPCGVCDFAVNFKEAARKAQDSRCGMVMRNLVSRPGVEVTLIWP